jgi:hypothetical protein
VPLPGSPAGPSNRTQTIIIAVVASVGGVALIGIVAWVIIARRKSLRKRREAAAAAASQQGIAMQAMPPPPLNGGTYGGVSNGGYNGHAYNGNGYNGQHVGNGLYGGYGPRVAPEDPGLARALAASAAEAESHEARRRRREAEAEEEAEEEARVRRAVEVRHARGGAGVFAVPHAVGDQADKGRGQRCAAWMLSLGTARVTGCAGCAGWVCRARLCACVVRPCHD